MPSSGITRSISTPICHLAVQARERNQRGMNMTTRKAKAFDIDVELEFSLKFWRNKLKWDRYLMSPSTIFRVESTVKLLEELERVRKPIIRG